METGFDGVAAEKRTYGIVDKMEKFGEKTGLVVNRKVTKLGFAVGAAATIAVFGGWALMRAFLKNVTRG
jgi:hypothetical protein